MRLILLLASALIVGLLVAQQIGPSSAPPAHGTADSYTVRTPDAPGELDRFADEMDRAVQDSAERRREAIEEQTR